jgi:hypothetical protein
VLFQKTGNDWKAFPSQCADQACLKTISSRYPAEVSWTIAFDGKALGQVTGRTVKEFDSYASIGKQEIVTSNNLPVPGTRSTKWGGVWDTKTYRPIVVVSQPNFKDTEGWKPVALNRDTLSAVREQFKIHYRALCRLDNDQDSIKQPWKYADSEIKVTRAYASNKNWFVVGMRLENVRDCDDEEAGFQIDDPWFTVDPKGTVRFLDAGLWLVDAGDYDNNGESEVLFVMSHSNGGGFELFYDNFSKHASFDLPAH